MNLTRRRFLGISSIALMSALGTYLMTGCSNGTYCTQQKSVGSLAFNNDNWSYDSKNDVYYQIGVKYCSSPAAEDFESLGIYVPGAYLESVSQSGNAHACKVDPHGKVKGFNASTAPIVMPINTAGYSAQPAPTSYDYASISEYLKAGFIYVYAGCRGRDNGENADGAKFEGGAPWGVADLKAAVRFLRYNKAMLPGNMDAIFSFGHSGGGAQSAVLGASGDSKLYIPYLDEIGAAINDEDGNEISDAIAGAMCWCPITSLDASDAAYEWMMGQYSSEGSRADGLWTAQLSKDLAAAYGEYINALGLVDDKGRPLVLEEGGEGVYDKGSYYDYVLDAINDSLNDFLASTTFPYTPSNSFMSDGGFGGERGLSSGTPPNGEPPSGNPPNDLPSGERPSDLSSGAAPNDLPTGEMPERPSDGESPSGFPSGDAPTNGGNNGNEKSSPSESSVTYETVQDYIDSLNGDDEWIEYDSKTNKAKIASIAAFTSHCKKPRKSVGAFDATDLSQAENKVFGTIDEDALHFDVMMAALLENNKEVYSQLSGWDESYVQAYAEDLKKTNSLGMRMADRADMYNPLFYVNDALGGEGTSSVAPYWRIHSGIEQGDTSLTTELNLACGLKTYSPVKNVEFAAVWGQGHTMAELEGSGLENFIAWIKDIAENQKEA